MQFALSIGQFRLAELLLARGADPRHTAIGGTTALHALALIRPEEIRDPHALRRLVQVFVFAQVPLNVQVAFVVLQ